MKKIIYKIFGWLIALAILGVPVYYFRIDLLNFKNYFFQQYFPCRAPITYQLGEFDRRFGVSQKVFLATVYEAEQIWEKPIGLNLFEYDPNGALKINLIYDYRQSATLKLRQLGIVVKDDQATYDKLKTDYNSLQITYLADKATLANQVAELDSRTATYNAEVASWNRPDVRRDAPSAEVDRLNAERAALNQLIADHNVMLDKFNNEVSELNALADTLNHLAQTLNLSVDKYNTVGASRGSEFEEGTYVSSAAGEEIDIYQFDNTQKLVRVLAHELGHALGLEHVSSTKAIMYYLNNGINEKLAPADILELKQRCGL